MNKGTSQEGNSNNNLKDKVFIVMFWLIAAAMAYIVYVKIRILFH